MAPTANAAPKTYALEQAELQPRTLEAQIKREFKPEGMPLDALLKEGVAAMKANNHAGAAEWFGKAIALDSNNEQAWRNFAITQQRISVEGWEARQKLRNRALTAAYKTYLVSTDTKQEARALAILADAYAQQENWRPALNAYKASLSLNDNPAARSVYDNLRREHGFRILDHSVDSDAANPRACVQFSEKLSATDLTPFIRVEGMENPAVSREDMQLCVDGLKHGQSYQVTVRAGIPSTVDEKLEQPSTLTLYVRDRKPAVRFTGRNYVLPRTGAHNIPVVTTNLDAVQVEILRVGDRGLATSVGGDFQRQLNYYSFTQLQENRAVPVYKGELAVKRDLNQDVTTAIPLDEALKKYQPGVYAMVAYEKGKEEDYEALATQWFVVSDLGLTAFSGNGIQALVRSLGSASPLKNVDVRLIARNNDVLAHARTDADGRVSFDEGVTRGAGGAVPELLIASTKEGDYGFLSLSQPGFDLSDRGVNGRTAPGPLDAQLFTDRGVYRPGETIHLTTLLRDDKAQAVKDLPLTLVVQRPDGAEDRRVQLADQGSGGRVFDLTLLDSSTTGTWRFKVYADPKQPSLGETAVLVEDYVPERLDLTLKTDATSLSSIPQPVTLDGKYLYGAPASDLAIEADLTVRLSSTPLKNYEGYQFGRADEEFSPVKTALANLPRTDAAGKARLDVALNAIPQSSRPLEAMLAVRLREASGRTLERTLNLPIAPTANRLGIKPLAKQLNAGETAQFDVVLLDAQNHPQPSKASWELYRLDTRFQWYKSGSNWDYETVTTSARVADGTLDITATPARISAKTDDGQYRLDVKTADGTASSVTFSAGYGAGLPADTPDMLDVALDKPSYTTGEEARVTLNSRFAGKATVMLVGRTVLATQLLDVPEGTSTVEFDVTEDWGTGVYAFAVVHRPLDAEASRMPGRAMGVAYAEADKSAQTLALTLNVPDKIAPRGTLDVPVRLDNLKGETAHLVLAAVDVGILNLTRFESPDPTKYFYGQQKLSTEVRDLYGQLIDGLRANRGALRSGGDGAGLDLGEPPTQEPLALFSGLVTVNADGTANVPLDLPAFNGTVRLMAVAWTDTKLGHAQKDVVVADPVVVQASLPRFLNTGDKSRLLVNLDNVEGLPGLYRLVTKVTGGVQAPDNALAQEIKLEAKGKNSLSIPLDAVTVGTARVDIMLTAPNGHVTTQAFALDVKPAQPDTSNTTVTSLIPSTGKLMLDQAMLKDKVPGTGRIALSVAPRGTLDPAASFAALDSYAYGCSEQLASRLTALIYADDLGTVNEETRSKAADIIARLLARQDSSGDFALWPGVEGGLWLNAFVTDTLSRAREKGYAIPDQAFALALNRLRNTLSYRSIDDGESIGGDLVYAHYVLARNGRGVVGDLRYLADTRLDAIASPLARAQLGAALGLMGDQARASTVFASVPAVLEDSEEDGYASFGTLFRDAAAIMAVAAESTQGAKLIQVAAKTMDDNHPARGLSTQENAWVLRAAAALKAQAEAMQLTLDGQPVKGVLTRVFRLEDLVKPVTIGNTGKEPVYANVTVSGSPLDVQPAAEEGLIVKRDYYTLDGQKADPASVKHNDRLVVVVSVEEVEPQASRLLVEDHLPAGFEIDNPRLVTGGMVEGLSWLPPEAEAQHAEFRDSKFVAAFDNAQGEAKSFTAAYVVRAVTPGSYAHPPALASDMYRPDRFARTSSGITNVLPQP
jgi:alpha-2-macroglobulin